MARPKGSKNIRTDSDLYRSIEIACKRMTAKAVGVLEKALTDDTMEMRWRLTAAKEVLDRGWGRPKQSTETVIKHESVDGMTEALASARKRSQRLVEASTEQVSVH